MLVLQGKTRSSPLTIGLNKLHKVLFEVVKSKWCIFNGFVWMNPGVLLVLQEIKQILSLDLISNGQTYVTPIF